MILRSFIKSFLSSSTIYRIRSAFFRSEIDKNQLRARVDFYKQFIRKKDIVFDIGANVGNRIDPFLAIGSRVVAVEPQPSCQEILRLNFGNRIKLVKAGAGPKLGRREMLISQDNVLSSFSPEWVDAVQKSGRFSYTSWNERLSVEIVTLDSLIARYGKPTFIKIDVEGFEFEVLQGLSVPIAYLSFEFTLPEGEDKLIMCLERLQELQRDCLYNFSDGESMTLALPAWVTKEMLLQKLRRLAGSQLHFGDIYCNSAVH